MIVDITLQMPRVRPIRNSNNTEFLPMTPIEIANDADLFSVYLNALYFYSLLNYQSDYNAREYPTSILKLPGEKTKNGLPKVSLEVTNATLFIDHDILKKYSVMDEIRERMRVENWQLYNWIDIMEDTSEDHLPTVIGNYTVEVIYMALHALVAQGEINQRVF